MVKRVLETIGQHGMVCPNDNVMVCVSGGADSMALLSLLLSLQRKLAIREVFACHYNHGLRGEESDRDEMLVRHYCNLHKVRLIVEYGEMAVRPCPAGKSTESYARELRYNFFGRCSQEWHPIKIAVAHTRSDVVETILFNLARGSGIQGAHGMPSVRGNIIRPLYDCTRSEVEQYCADNHVPYVTDSTNTELRYARNRIRHQVVPELERSHNGAERHIAQFGKRAEAAYRYIAGQAQLALQRAQKEEGYDVEVLKQCDPFLLEFILKHLIEECGVDANARLLQAAGKLLNGMLREVQLNNTKFLCARTGILFCFDARQTTPSKVHTHWISPGKSFDAGDYYVRITPVGVDGSEIFTKSSKRVLNNAMDCGKIIGNVILRGRKPGDSLTSPTRKLTKSLKKLYNEFKIPLSMRASWPVLSDDEGVLWVFGQGIDKRVAVDNDTTVYFDIQVEKKR